MNISKREKRLIIIVLILAILCVYYIYFLKPYFDDMRDLASAKSSKEALVLANEQQLSRIALLDSQIEEKEKEIEDYSVSLSQGFDQPPILVYLEKVITQNAQKVMFEFGDVTTYEQLEICPITVTMKSTYNELKAILDELSNDEYFIKVTSLNAIITDAVPVEVVSKVYDEVLGEYTEIITTQIPGGANMLDVTLSLEFYNNAGDIPPDTDYEFDDSSIGYGGDIFF